MRSRADHSFCAGRILDHHDHDGRCGWRDHLKQHQDRLDGAGTITTYTPGSDYITFRTETERGAGEVLLHQEDGVGGREGKPVEWSLLRPDMPVRYTYVKEGDRMVVSKSTS